MDKNALKLKVIAVLHEDEEARNNDKELAWKLWRKFYPGAFFFFRGEFSLTREGFDTIPSYAGIVRIRADVQNKQGLYLPTSWEIAKKRGLEEDSWRKALGYSPKQ